MKFIYKTVALENFLSGAYSGSGLSAKFQSGSGNKMGISTLTALFGGERDQAKKMSDLMDYLLNFYGAEGWEYYEMLEFSPNAMKSNTTRSAEKLVNSLVSVTDSFQGKYPILIFRKNVSEEEFIIYQENLLKNLNEPQKNYVNNDGSNETTIINEEGAICPNCSASIKLDSVSCFKCGASFGENASWRPIPT